MKKWFWILFVVATAIAQEMPVSESNYFVYNKYQFGVDLNNLSINIHPLSNGEIVCSEYSGYIYKVSNTSVKKALPTLKDKNPVLQNYLQMPDGSEYYCTTQEIIIAQKDQVVKRIKINSQNDHSSCFQKLGAKVFFITHYFDGSLFVRSYNGKKVTSIAKMKKEPQRYNHQLFVNKKIFLVEYENHQIVISEIIDAKQKLIKKYNFDFEGYCITKFIDENNFYGSTRKQLIHCVNGRLSGYKMQNKSYYNPITKPIYNTDDNVNKSFYKITDSNQKVLFNTTFSSKVFLIYYNKESNSYYSGTSTQFLRFFPHIKKYPRLYNNTNSNAIFSIVQDKKNRIWAGSYQGALSVIDGDKLIQSQLKDLMFMNGGLAINDKMLLFAESLKGALLFSDPNTYRRIADSTTFFYGYISKDKKLYLGSSTKGLWFTNVENLEQNKPIKWNKITEKQGLKLYNIISICEDKFGNIWTGRTSQGIAVYNPTNQKVKTWLKENNEIDFGSQCILLDTKQTLWFGTQNGKLYNYNGSSKEDWNVKNFKSIEHPLLNSDKEVSFMQQWKNYLIIGVEDRVLFFDLQKWYQNKKVAVRYLNPMEINLTNSTEQNAVLTDQRDESIWFATSDMLYNLDIKRWLTLPTFTVKPSILIKKNKVELKFKSGENIEFKPTENSFDIQIEYQTKDNMPRFINGVLVKKGEKPVFENPNLQNQFHFANLSSGNYTFYIRVCQQDGSYDVFEYPIVIRNFLWQNGWFWCLISLFPIGFVIFYFRKKNQIEQQKKKLSQLNLSSLSNQFRPHFMLNALNSIGSQLEDKPHAEKVISRLGESINILYSFTQKNKFTLSFQNEWKLVLNSIEIQRLLFIPELVVEFENQNLIPNDFRIPVGLLQIPVENALLHGLRNKTDGNCILKIRFQEDAESYFITILDNGVGRENAQKMNNFKKNGKGLKTIFEIIKIINENQKDTIQFEIIDHQEPVGTQVSITIKKNSDYERIKL